MNQSTHTVKTPPSEEKRALLARLLREKASKPKAHPVSFGQQRLWFIDRLEPGSAAYNMPAALRLRGALEAEALQTSFNELARRHAILRTTLTDVDGEPMQWIHPPTPLRLKIYDLSDLAKDERDRRTLDILEEEVGRPFDLAAGPLWRTTLIRLENDEHLILVNLHHIVTDGLSTAILFDEVLGLYRDAVADRPSSLPEPPIQYADYARWQRNWMQSKAFADEMAYWRERLGGRLPKLELPTDYPRPNAQDYSGASRVKIVDRPLLEALNALSRRGGATLFMTLLAAFKILLYRCTGQEDLVIGATISGRTQRETEKLIGFFVNTLLLRTDLSAEPTFLDLLQRVKDTALGALANQFVPFEKLVEELNPERNLGKNPLFEIMFNFGTMPRSSVDLADFSLSFVNLGAPQAKHAVTLYADEGADRLTLSLVYQRALFASERMQILLQQYTHLLAQIVEAPGKSIDSYSLRAPETLHLLPDPRAPLAELDYEPVTESFRRWAERMPENVAVRQLGREYSYRQLQERADEISQRLLSDGLQPGETVGALGPRSFGLIACMIAILQAGGVLVLVDRTHPENRRRQLLAESRAQRVLLVCENDAAETSEPPALCIAAVSGEIIDGSSPLKHRPHPRPSPRSPAYISFTSGSTGTPKGVLCTHRGLAHFIAWEREEFEVTPADRVAQLSRLSFDVAMRDIFLPLTSGGALCLPPDQTRFSTDQLLDWFESEAVSIVHIVPAVAAAGLAGNSSAATLKTLRWTLFAGEALTASLAQRWREAFPQSGRIANLYGPTETTLAKFCYRLPEQLLPGVQPVGRPLPSTQALVINKQRELCGVGEPGEIVIRTPYRSLGYINAESEQNHRFAVNPYRNEPDDVLYFTGDLGKYRADGSLAIEGRLDHQVKIGGVRIELGEIQSVIVKHPDISQCVVKVWTDPDENQRLVAYITPMAGSVPSIRSLRGLVKRELPKYLHPSFFIMLEKMPLSPNGKVDLGALPEPGSERPDTENDFVAPRDETELKLSQIWEEILKIKPIGVFDDFFDLGGHSLLAVRLMSQIHTMFGVRLSLASLFEEATIEKLALRLRDRRDSGSDPLVAIQPSGRLRPLFLVHPAGGNVLCYADLANRLGKDRPLYGLQSTDFEGDQEPLDTIEAIAARYVEAVTRFDPTGPYLLGGWSMGAIVAYGMAQQFLSRGQEVAFLALLDHRPPDPPPDPEDSIEALDEISLMQRFFDGCLDLENLSLEAMDENQRLDFFLLEAKRRNLLSSDVSATQVRAYLKVYRANLRALHRYEVKPYPGRVTFLKTRSDIAETDPTLGWGSLAGQGVEVLETPGKHFDMVADPHAITLARLLTESLARAEGTATGPADRLFVPTQ